MKSSFCVILTLIPYPAFAQTPLAPPQLLPPSIQAPATAAAKMPRDEKLTAMDFKAVRVQHKVDRVAVTMGVTVFREFGTFTDDAELTAKLLQELKPTLWGTLGTSRVIVEYGLTVDGNGQTIVPPNSGFPNSTTPIDLKSLRADQVRGVWCVRDANLIHFNFGMEKVEAEQCVAVCRKYGFNRIGTIGRQAVPALVYLFAGPLEAVATTPATAALTAQQEKMLTRVGLEVPGLGVLGEKLVFDARKLEVKREGHDTILVHGRDTIARFGHDDWSARDGARALQDARLNELCKFGTSGVTFFLKDGVAPTAVPFAARTTKFDAASLKPKEITGQWHVVDGGGKALFAAASEVEAATLIRMLKAYQFDTIAAIGNSPKQHLRILVRSR